MQLPKHILTAVAMKVVHLVHPAHEAIKPPTMALTVHPALYQKGPKFIHLNRNQLPLNELPTPVLTNLNYLMPMRVEKTTAPLPGNK